MCTHQEEINIFPYFTLVTMTLKRRCLTARWLLFNRCQRGHPSSCLQQTDYYQYRLFNVNCWWTASHSSGQRPASRQIGRRTLSQSECQIYSIGQVSENWNHTLKRAKDLWSINTHTHTHTHTHDHTTGETLDMSQQEKSPLWIQSPEETSRVWIHGSRFSVPVPYNTQLKQTHTHTHHTHDTQTHTQTHTLTHTDTHTYVFIESWKCGCRNNFYLITMHTVRDILGLTIMAVDNLHIWNRFIC